MDIELYSRVIWRHKWIVATGFMLALLLAVFSYVRIGSGGISYRHSEQWVSYETVSVTQPGFTEGQLNAHGANPARLALLAVLYSKYVDSDAVRHSIWPHGPGHETIEAAPVLAVSNSSAAGPLPIISLAGFSSTPHAAQRLAARTTEALMRYIARRQQDASVPVVERVELQPVKRALSNKPILWKGRTKTLPIVVFLTVAIATMGLAFILENLNPQIRALADAEEENLKRVAGRSRA